MSKKKRPEAASDLCSRALARVEQAIRNHEAGAPEDLSISVLQKVAAELRRMAETLDRSKYQPGYGRALLDWPDDHGLVEYLLDVSQKYKSWT